MKTLRVVIAGGSGFLGRNLARRLEAAGHQPVILTRRPTGPHQVHWQPNGSTDGLERLLDGVDAMVNLAGEGIADKRWTPARKEAIRRSRIAATRTLVRAISGCATPPRVFISGSAIGYYGSHGDEAVIESTPPGSDFLARVCVDWEQEARALNMASTRLAIVRTGLAVGKDGGALARMLLPFKLGLGGTVGSGEQYMPWIHVDDWCAMVMWLIENDRASGAFNATAPEPVTNRAFTRTLARVLGRPAIFRVPAFVLQLALGEMSSMLLTGQRVLPAFAEQHGFVFSYRTLEPALRSLHL
jgi:uncharacterized protein (TIGR01777 family)